LNCLFWADQQAREVIKIRGDKDSYVCAAGITPSGPKHIGNYREIITVDLVVKALRSMGKKVKFIYSWDSYDRLRKIPAEVPEDKRELMEKEIGKPVCDVIDPWGCHKSWGEHWIEKLEEEVARTGVEPEYQYQHKLYRKCLYADEIKKAMVQNEKIKEILNEYRKEPLSKGWYPIEVYCEKCGKDFTKVMSYDNEYTITYECKCGHKDTIDFSKKGIVKLRWRVDWPMRWAYYNLDFEPAGKDHMVEGSSRTTGMKIIKNIYGREGPYGFLYGLVRKKGGPGKMSASKGNVIFVSTVLDVYLPEVLRYFFVGNRPAKDFQISFDEDILKVYEDFYTVEKTYYGLGADVNEKDLMNCERIYELCCIGDPPKQMCLQPSFRQASIAAQICDSNMDAAKLLGGNTPRIQAIIKCARNWIENYAPEDYKFTLNEEPPKIELSPRHKEVIKGLVDFLSGERSEEEIKNELFRLFKENEVPPREFFPVIYRILFGKESGPRLVQFIKLAGPCCVKDLLTKLL